jgi:hypothetical protein
MKFLPSPESKGALRCEVCAITLKTNGSDFKYWRCEESIDHKTANFDGICANCYSKNFIRRNLTKKTDKHSSYKSLVIKPV